MREWKMFPFSYFFRDCLNHSCFKKSNRYKRVKKKNFTIWRLENFLCRIMFSFFTIIIIFKYYILLIILMSPNYIGFYQATLTILKHLDWNHCCRNHLVLNKISAFIVLNLSFFLMTSQPLHCDD